MLPNWFFFKFFFNNRKNLQVNQDCIKEIHVNAVIEQLEKVVEHIKKNLEKGVGYKIASIIDTSVTDDEINNMISNNNTTATEVCCNLEVKSEVNFFYCF